MGKRKLLTPVTIGQVIGPHKTREIVVNVGVSEQSVKNWVKCLKREWWSGVLSAKPQPGFLKKTSVCA